VDNQGERGDAGQRGIAGERGPKGDHGQHGEHGGEGIEGRQGPRGLQGIQGKTEPTILWFGWKKWTWATLAFLFIVMSGAYATYSIDARFSRQVADTKQATIDGDYRICVGGNKIRSGIRKVLSSSYPDADPRREAALSEFILRECEIEYPNRSTPTPTVTVKAP